METDTVKTGTVIISVAVIVIIEISAKLLISRDILVPLIGLMLARVAEIIMLLIVVKARQHHISAIGLAPSGMVKGLQKGLIWAASFGVAAGIVLLIIHLTGIQISGLFRMQLPAGSHRLFTFLLVGVLIGPVAEEIFFRGILYGFFRKWGVPTAIVMSTLLFILPHAHTTGSAIPITQIIGGILFAVSYEVEKNLIVPITIHCLGNLAIFTFASLF